MASGYLCKSGHVGQCKPGRGLGAAWGRKADGDNVGRQAAMQLRLACSGEAGLGRGKKRNHHSLSALCRATLLAGEPSVVLYWLLYSVARACACRDQRRRHHTLQRLGRTGLNGPGTRLGA